MKFAENCIHARFSINHFILNASRTKNKSRPSKAPYLNPTWSHQ